VALNGLTKLGPNSLPPKLSLDELNVSGITTSGSANVSGVTTSGAFHGPLVGSVTGGNIDGTATGLAGSPDIDVGRIDATSTVTATGFVGPLVGNVQGTSTGLSGSPNITVNSLTSANLITGNISGTSSGLTGIPDITVNKISAGSSITTADKFYGDGSALTGIEVASAGEVPHPSFSWMAELAKETLLTDDTVVSASSNSNYALTKLPTLIVADTKSLEITNGHTFIIGVYGII